MSNIKKLMMSSAGGKAGADISDIFSTYTYEGNGNQISAAGSSRKEILEDFQISDRIVVNSFSNDTSKEDIYTTTGTYSWTCPAGVTSVCVVCVGGGAGNAGGGAKAGGGGLGWKNDIPVTPGNSYTVVVGRAGPNGWQGGGGLNNGGDSYFINTSTVAGFGGKGYGSGDQGGGFVGGGGGSGGKGTYNTGGGAGGYLGNGGYGREHQNGCNQTGKGGAGSGAPTWASGQNGGGVGIYGAGESGTTSSPYHGSVGNGAPSTAYGGGEGSSNGAGGGAVRIIWGSGRKFPFAAGYQSEQIPGTDSMVWLKSRDSSSRDHYLAHTEDGFFAPGVYPNQNYAGTIYADFLNAKSSGGVDIMHSTTASQNQNQTNEDYVAWSFKKQEKFFDIVTYTGNGAQGRAINHNLNSVPGFIVVKKTNGSGNWPVYHRGMTSALYGMQLNTSNDQFDADSYWDSTDPTASVFTVGNNADVNASGSKYVAYLFAHNNGDGEFGPDSDQDIIKCGSYTGAGHSGVTINLGFEPQFVIIKKTNASALWTVIDTMRGMPSGSNSNVLYPNTSQAEADPQSNAKVYPTPTGLYIEDDATELNTNNGSYIYMAIRRGSLFPPKDATEVFAIDTGAGTGVPMFGSGFPVDFAMGALPYTSAHDKRMSARLAGIGYGNVENSPWYTDSNMKWDHMEGYYDVASNQSTWISWMWKRAPGYFDVVAYEGNGTNPHNISHNLSVAPEMMWVKRRDSSGNWEVYYDTGNPGTNNGLGLLRLNSTGTDLNGTFVWGNTHPTDSVFTVGSNGTNRSGADFIAYLFASAPGVSKVGSFSHTYGGTTNVDCGFTSGARFVLWKRTDGTRHWELFDTTRGIVAGNDAYLRLSDSSAQTSGDYIDPYSAGFSVGSSLGTGEFIFYAIA